LLDFIPTATSKDEAERDAAIALLPVGSFEQHGHYLPLATDTIVACVLPREPARQYPVMVLPPITISCSHEHAGWRGTVNISARALHQVVTDIADSLATSGIHRLVILSGHGGNYVLNNVVQEASVAGPVHCDLPAAGRVGAGPAGCRHGSRTPAGRTGSGSSSQSPSAGPASRPYGPAHGFRTADVGGEYGGGGLPVAVFDVFADLFAQVVVHAGQGSVGCPGFEVFTHTGYHRVVGGA
jgi:hypothetical protein